MTKQFLQKGLKENFIFICLINFELEVLIIKFHLRL